MPQRLSILVNGGDWACAHADSRSLTDVCRELAHIVGPELGTELQGVARDAEIDMERASWAWLSLSAKLRRVPFEDSPNQPPA